MRLPAIRTGTGVVITAVALLGGLLVTQASAPAAPPAAAVTLAAPANRPATPPAPAVPDFPREGQPNLYTRDPARLSAFYQQLGFVERYRFPLPDGTVAFTTLQKGPFYLTLTHLDVIRQATGLRWTGVPLLHSSDITVLVSDVDAVVAGARAHGAPVLMAPRNQPWGERQAYLVDPEGNYVQVSTHH